MRSCQGGHSLTAGGARMPVGWALVATACLVLVPVSMAGTPVSWDGGTGFWDDPDAWDLSLVPDNNGQTYDVTIGSPADDVSLNTSVTVDTVANAGTLRFLDGFSLSLAQPGGLTNTGMVHVDHAGVSGLFGAFNNTGFTWIESGVLELNDNVNNAGTMWLGDGSYAGGTAELRILDDLTLGGSGELYFYSSSRTLADQPLISIPLGVTLTNGPEHRLHGGAGRIEGMGSFVNQGLIDADAPLRTLTLDLDHFANEGDLYARSGNLNVNVDAWHNSGHILIANGSESIFNGTLLTNDASGIVQSVGGAELEVAHDVTNFGLIATGGSGSITLGGSNTLITNAPGARMEATSGTIRFEATNGYLQNLGALTADQGSLEFANGVDVFGGSMTLTDSGHATVTSGTTSLTQVQTSLDATSSLAVLDEGTGVATLSFDGILTNAGGRLIAESESGGTATFNLSGVIYDDAGTILSDGGDFNISNAFWHEADVLALDMRNGGDIGFSNTDSTASQIDVSWTGTGGDLVFDNYRKAGTPTHLDLSGWTADNGVFTVSGGSTLTGSGLTTLADGTVLTVSGTDSSLSLSDLSQTSMSSTIDLTGAGTLAAANLAVEGEFKFRGGTFDGNLTLEPSAVFSATSSTNLITGDFSWIGDRDIELSNGSVRLGIGGSTTVAPGSSMRLSGNSTRFEGAGTLTNSGLIEGGAVSNGNSTYLDIDTVNNIDGVIRAAQNGEATNTNFQVTSDVGNAGLMEADGANLYFTGASVQNSGTFQAADHAAGSKLMFLGGTTVTDLGGSTLVDGAQSRLEVSGGADVELGTLTFSNGGAGSVTGTDSVLTANNVVGIPAGTIFSATSNGRFEAAGVDLDGQLSIQSGGTVAAPVSVSPGAQVWADSGIGTLDGAVDVANGGVISLVGNNAQLNGAGVITNSGLIEGGAPSNSYNNYLHNDVVNNADGVVRAFQNGTATGTYFRLSGNIDNQGLMEADGANLYFNGATVTNDGTLRAVDHAAGSKLTFLNGTTVTDAGGTTLIDGGLSTLEVSGGAATELGALSFTNGGSGLLTGAGSTVVADTMIDTGSTFQVRSSGELSGPSVQVDGMLDVYNATVSAPVTISGTGEVVSSYPGTAYPARFEAPVTIDDGGVLSMYVNTSTVNGSGVITNSGLIQGGATSNSQNTYLYNDVVNTADGVVRAFQNGTATNTSFRLSGGITNDGTMEAEGGRLYFNGAAVANSGVLRAVDHPAGSKLIFASGATVTDFGGSTLVDGAASALEVSAGSSVNLGDLSFTNGATGFVTGADSVVLADTTIAPGSLFQVQSNGVLAGPSVQVDGSLEVYNASVTAPMTISSTGEVESTYQSASYPARFEAPVTVDNGGRLSMYRNNTAVSGAGQITNHGLIQGGATSSSQNAYLYNNVINAADGVIRAFQNGTAANTNFRLSGNITNEGTMEADGGNLYVTGASITNSGTLQALDNAAGSKLIFLNGTTVADAGGSTLIDGAASALEVSGAATVELGTLSFSNGATGFVSGNGSTISADTTISSGSEFLVQSNAVLAGPSVQVGGSMEVYNASVTAPMTISGTGEVRSTYAGSSYPARFEAPVTIENGGRLSLDNQYATVSGAGLITNHGAIEGASTGTNLPTYLYSNVINESDGVIRAVQNGDATGTRLQMYGATSNDGLIEASGGDIYFMGGSSVANNGALQAINGHEIRVQDGATVTDSGSGTFSMSSGGTGYLTGSGTSVYSAVDVAEGSRLDLRSGAVLGGPNLNVAGEMEIYNATVEAPFTIAATGQVRSTYPGSGNPARLNAPVTIENGGELLMDVYYATVDGTGSITSHGLIQGASNHASYPQTYLYNDVLNSADGVIRAADNGTITNGRLQLYGSITNQGTMEANGGDLWFGSDAAVVNSGLIQAVDHAGASVVQFLSGATVTDSGGATLIDGALSSLEVSGQANVELGTLSFTNGGSGYVTSLGSVVTADTLIGTDSSFLVQNNALLDGAGVDVEGLLEVYNATIGAPVSVLAGGELASTYGSPSYPALLNSPVDVADGGTLSMYFNSAAISGDGLITNSGLIEGAAHTDNNSTYLYSTVQNQADGVIRAGQNGEAINTTLYVYGDIDNAGVIEADGGSLYFSGSDVTNSGEVRAINGNEVTFAAGTTLADAGGTLLIGDASAGRITGSSTRVDTALLIEPGATFTIESSGRLGGPSAQVDGDMYVRGSSHVESPLSVGLTGHVVADSSYAYFDDQVTVAGNGVEAGRISLLTSGAQVDGLGDIENFGLIEGGSSANGGTTYLHNETVNRPTGIVRAFSNGGATNTTFALSGNLVNQGLLEADGATLSMTGVTVDNTAGAWSAVNGGRLLVSGSFVGGSSGSSTTIDGDDSSLELVSGSLVGFDSLTLSNGGDVSVSGTNSSLFVISPFLVPDSSVATVASSGRLQAGGITLDGTLAAQGGTVISDVHLNGTGLIDATSGSTTIQGDVSTTAGSLISVANGSTSLVVNGSLDNVSGATVSLNTNTVALSGAGLFTNDGLLEAGAFNNNSTVTMSKDLVNTGQVVADAPNGATGTIFSITSPTIDNGGTMVASGANLQISGSLMDHSGTLRAEAGNYLRIQSTSVSNLGGGAEIDGTDSLFDVRSSSSVDLATLALTTGGDVAVSGSASLNVDAPFTVGADSSLTLSGNATMSGGGVQVDHLMQAGYSRMTAPTTIGPTGELLITSSNTAYFDAPVTVETDGGINDGRIALLGNSYRMGGSGTITNSGLIEGGAVSNGYSTFIDNDLVIAADGEVRAIQNGGAVNTYLQMTGLINNAGLMEADGANLYFTGATLQNSGTLRAVDHADGSKLIFLASTTGTDAGGSTQIDGALSELQVSGGADVALGSLSFTNGATGYVSGSGSVLTADASIDAGSTLSVQSSAVLGGLHTQVDGTLEVYNATVTSPVTISATGEAISTYAHTSYPARFDGAVNVESGGRLSMYDSGNVITGAGLVTNHGVLQGASAATGGSTHLYSDVANASDGVVRAAQNDTATNTSLYVYGSITNEGLMEANGGHLRFASGSSVANSGTLQALGGNEIHFTSGATVTDAGGMFVLSGGGNGYLSGAGTSVSSAANVADGSSLSASSSAYLGGASLQLDGTLDVTGGADAQFGSWQLGSTGSALVTGSGSTLAGGFAVGSGASIQVQNSAQLTVEAGGLTNDGTVAVSGSGSLVANGPVVSNAGSELSFADGSSLDFNSSLAIGGVLDMAGNSMDVDGDLSFGTDGRFRATAGSSITLTGDLANASEQSADFDTADLTLDLAVSFNAADPLLLEVAGRDLDNDVAGLNNNFALDSLLISGDDAFVQLVDVFDNPLDGGLNDALYISSLTITDLDSRLILDQFNVYYGVFNGDPSQIDVSGGGSFIQLGGLVPEPTALALLVIGSACLAGRRRRRFR